MPGRGQVDEALADDAHKEPGAGLGARSPANGNFAADLVVAGRCARGHCSDGGRDPQIQPVM